MESVKGKIIAISSFKGGVGKTITTLNLAGAFSKLNKKVLVVDLDLESGSISLILNTKNVRTLYNIVDDLSNNRFKDYKDYVESYNGNIDIVNSLKDPRHSTSIDTRYIELFLSHVSYKYDVILLDTNHGFSPTTITALDVADINLFIVTNDILDIKAGKTVMAIMNNLGKDNIKVLLNESIKITNNYFRRNDIENLIKKEINYVVNKSYHIKDITNYILDGNILTLNPKLKGLERPYLEIAKDLIEGEKL